MQLVQGRRPEAGVGRGPQDRAPGRGRGADPTRPVGTTPPRSAGCWSSAAAPVCTSLDCVVLPAVEAHAAGEQPASERAVALEHRRRRPARRRRRCGSRSGRPGCRAARGSGRRSRARRRPAPSCRSAPARRSAALKPTPIAGVAYWLSARVAVLRLAETEAELLARLEPYRPSPAAASPARRRSAAWTRVEAAPGRPAPREPANERARAADLVIAGDAFGQHRAAEVDDPRARRRSSRAASAAGRRRRGPGPPGSSRRWSRRRRRGTPAPGRRRPRRSPRRGHSRDRRPRPRRRPAAGRRVGCCQRDDAGQRARAVGARRPRRAPASRRRWPRAAAPVQITQPPNGSFCGTPSRVTSARLAPEPAMPRSETPWVVGLAPRLEVRRNSEKPGAGQRVVQPLADLRAPTDRSARSRTPASPAARRQPRRPAPRRRRQA